jgi:hypothetical protein
MWRMGDLKMGKLPNIGLCSVCGVQYTVLGGLIEEHREPEPEDGGMRFRCDGAGRPPEGWQQVVSVDMASPGGDVSAMVVATKLPTGRIVIDEVVTDATLAGRIRIKIESLRGNGLLTPEEEAVLSLIRPGERITQREIARSEPWLGCHPEHEQDVVKNEYETTTRRVRQIVRDLKVKRGIPVLADARGYFLPKTMAEADEYLARLEREVAARNAASLETYRAMASSLGLKSLLLDRLAALPFGRPADPEEDDGGVAPGVIHQVCPRCKQMQQDVTREQAAFISKYGCDECRRS